MENKSLLFAEFSAISREEWMAKIEKDLKGKALETLNWESEPGLELPPLHHSTDSIPANVVADDRRQNQWEIGQLISVSNLKEANRAVINNLAGGVNALQFQIETPLTVAELNVLLKDVIPSYISLHFEWKRADFPIQAFWANLSHYLTEQDNQGTAAQGSFLWEPATRNIDLQLATKLFSQTGAHNFQFITITSQETSGSSIEELASLVGRGQAHISKLQDLGIAPQDSAKHIQFSLSIGNTFFLEIAKIRALKLLWANVLAAYQVPSLAANINAYTSAPETGEDPYHFMIQSATQAMSAVMGGANRLFVTPADHGSATADNRFRDNPDFGPRIARNVQHLLQMESFLDRVIDPGAGSYYIENLTQQLATKAWVLFQENAL